MRYALVGMGSFGQKYIRNLKELKGSELVGMHSRTQASYDNLPEDLKIAPYFASYNDMLRYTGVETVIIASFPDSHYNLSASALWCDKNVICEKPCMFTDEEFFNIEELVGRRVFFTDYTNIYHKVVQDMRRVLEEDDSNPRLTLVNTGNGPIRDVPGLCFSDLQDYGSHVASVIYHLFPNANVRINSMGKTEEGNYIFNLGFENTTIRTIFGNKSKKRLHSFELFVDSKSVFWANDGTDNPLKVVLEKFSQHQIDTNLSLSRRVRYLLSDMENMNE